jgi:hypothetical protein
MNILKLVRAGMVLAWVTATSAAANETSCPPCPDLRGLFKDCKTEVQPGIDAKIALGISRPDEIAIRQGEIAIYQQFIVREGSQGEERSTFMIESNGPDESKIAAEPKGWCTSEQVTLDYGAIAVHYSRKGDELTAITLSARKEKLAETVCQRKLTP